MCIVQSYAMLLEGWGSKRSCRMSRFLFCVVRTVTSLKHPLLTSAKLFGAPLTHALVHWHGGEHETEAREAILLCSQPKKASLSVRIPQFLPFSSFLSQKQAARSKHWFSSKLCLFSLLLTVSVTNKTANHNLFFLECLEWILLIRIFYCRRKGNFKWWTF